ncbi:MAG: hypothetical protein ACLFVJ_07375, partial [Persicimonas sp.]
MADFVFGADRIYAPFEIDSSNNTLRVTDLGGTDDISVSADTYYNHLDDSDSDYPGLLDKLEDALNASSVLAGTYSISSSTPDGSELTNSGITISDSSGGPFTLEFDHANTTLDPRLLGFASDASDQTADAEDPAATLDSPYSLWSVW